MGNYEKLNNQPPSAGVGWDELAGGCRHDFQEPPSLQDRHPTGLRELRFTYVYFLPLLYNPCTG